MFTNLVAKLLGIKQQETTWTLKKPAQLPSLTPEERRIRSVHAQQLLDNAILQGAFYALQSDIIGQLDKVKLDDRDGHQRLVMALQTAKAVERHLWLLVQDGYEATQQIQLRGKRID